MAGSSEKINENEVLEANVLQADTLQRKIMLLIEKGGIDNETGLQWFMDATDPKNFSRIRQQINATIYKKA